MNLAGYLLTRENVLVSSGLNLPMLLECAFNRDKPIEKNRRILKAAYQNGMTVRNSNTLNEEEEDDDCIL